MTRLWLSGVSKRGLTIAALAFVAGVVVMLVATVVFGDWSLIRRPWSDAGLSLITFGLAAAFLFSIVRLIVGPIGRLTILAVPGIALTGCLWIAALYMPLSGACCEGPSYPLDPGTMLYSLPILIPALAASTALIGAPWLVASLRQRGA